MFRRRRIKEEEDVSLSHACRGARSSRSKTNLSLSLSLSLSHIHISSRIVYFVGDLAQTNFWPFFFSKISYEKKEIFKKFNNAHTTFLNRSAHTHITSRIAAAAAEKAGALFLFLSLSACASLRVCVCCNGERERENVECTFSNSPPFASDTMFVR